MNPITRWKRASQSFMTAWHYPNGKVSMCGYPIPEDAEWAEGHPDCPRCLSVVIDAATLYSKANKRKAKAITRDKVQAAMEEWLAKGGQIDVQDPEPTPERANLGPMHHGYEEIGGLL